MEKEIAVILPCLNEALTIGKVIEQVKTYLPESKIYVVDNLSDDNSIEEAKKYDGVNILVEQERGKGNVIKKAFNSIDADIYVMIDADATYEVCELPNYIKVFVEKDMNYLNIVREYSQNNKFNPLRKFGNRLFNFVIKMLLGQYSNDILSGFKIFSKKFVQEFEIKTKGFEIETEMYIFARKNNYINEELSCKYYSRVKNSHSKLSIFKDGFCILKYIVLKEIK